MRRSRIKAVATVPARRKPINSNPKDEKSEPTNKANQEIDENNKKPTEITPQHAKAGEREINEPTEPLKSTNEPETENQLAVESPKKYKIDNAIEIIESTISQKDCLTVESSRDVNEEKAAKDDGNASENSGAPDVDSQIFTPNKVPQNKISSTTVELKNVAEQENTPFAKVLHQTRTSFMRPTPRLDGGGRIRRNSVQGSGASASESEDDCRRSASVLTNRVRNDSISSLQSTKSTNRENPGQTNLMTSTGNSADKSGTSPTKTMSSLAVRQKRKMNVSESARKLAEARREFQLKYEHKQPDRTKLTMYDLIYYNPITNPIKKSDRIPSAPKTVSSASPTHMEIDEDEEEDCDTPEALPVPQVKVGPDGHLILDEQSLVIEHTGAKKNRQALARTEALVDDDCNGNGFYKKRQKTRDWPRWETLKFYKALNTVGTDFLLMQSLFPQRTRHEIKMKFKKEEKTNRRCIEKALTFHQEFDIESLKEDLASFEVAKSKHAESSKPEKPVRRSKSLKTQISKPPQVAVSSSEESGAGEESDPEIYQVKPTRSGRLPKVRKLQAPKINTLDNLFSDPETANEPPSPRSSIPENERAMDHTDEGEIPPEKTSEETHNILEKVPRESCISDITQVEPGSLVIVSRESEEEPGETVLQVYMVSPDLDDGTGQNMMPVKLTPELLNTVSAGMTNVNPINFNTN
ncbi:transcription factor TFIIIB component B'' homolog [Venturia canescens]|uniref:transcription factor TFIIIB component B'' homolog n=1 Tax=Venturia canescens TaxID=32260 RepID=UPI001C9C5079|nr:transcription factor TFIIIB component B'' homolog [Venturia canescens]XP_043278681.1 transcription factor TFIIIB component B'' homolog [Venturia canescens]